MGVLALLVGIALAVEGLIGMIAPGALLAAGRILITPAGLIAVAVVRVAIGGVLLGAARASRFPRVFQVLGVIVIIAGLATPVFGVDRARAVVEFAAQRSAVVRLVGALAMLGGAFIAYAARGSHVKAL